MTTIRDIAKRARVSVGTASHVLNGSVPVSEPLRARVLAAVHELDYHPNLIARSLKTRNTKTLGMVVSDITNPFFPQVIRGAESEASLHGYSIITFNTDDQLEREKHILGLFRSRRVDGILLVVAPGAGDVAHIQGTLDAGVPVVCIDRVPAGIDVDTVTVDNAGGALECVRHLIAEGHRNIATITGPLSLTPARERLRGYELALREAGLAAHPEFIKEAQFRREAAVRACQELMSAGGIMPTAIFACNNTIAIGVIEALNGLGLACPGDVALAEFDDPSVPDVFRPAITSVAQPAREIGRRGVEVLLARIRGEAGEAPVHVELPTTLHVRESSAFVVRAAGARRADAH
jgi:LacI family transcriptional regulator